MTKSKDKSIANKPDEAINTLDCALKHLLKTAEEGLIIFDLQGKIIAINPKAAQYLGSSVAELTNKYFKSALVLNSFTRKRQFIQLCSHFNAAKAGVCQNYTWIEYVKEKPISAYNILINKEEIHGNVYIFAQIKNVLHIKIIDWALWSLAKIGNHHEITGIIDELVKLASNLFAADYAAVCLIDNQGQFHAVSFYQLAHKKENASYPL